MTLRKSLILSLGLHILLFGTGLAFARFAGELFHPQCEPVVVSLIGNGGSATTGRKKTTGRRLPDPIKNERPKERSVSEQPIEKQALIPAPAPSSIPDGDNSGQQHARLIGHENGGNERASMAGSASGSVSSEQWAVIVSSIERAKTYPRLARERGIEGTVHVRFRLKPQGDVDRVEVIKSSGFDILDEASVRTVYRAGPMPYVTGWIEVPIAYVLK